MAKRLSICAALAFNAFCTFGMVYVAPNFEAWRLMPTTTFKGFFAHTLVSIWGVWSQIHGFAPLTHPDEFGEFYARLIFLVFPLVGLGLFWLGTRWKVGKQLWKPLAIALLFTTPVEGLVAVSFQVLGLNIATAEAARSMVVLLLMLLSIGAVRFPRASHATPQ